MAWTMHVEPHEPDDLKGLQITSSASMNHCAEHLIVVQEANHIIDDAPEWLRRYIVADTAAYARDVGIELHVAERADGGLFVFDTHA